MREERNIISSKLPIILFGFLVLSFLFYTIHCSAIILFPYDLDYYEGHELRNAVLLSEGNSIYTSLNEPPYVPSTYTPLYSIVAAALIKIFGVGFFAGRFLTFIASLIIGVLIFDIVKTKTNNTFIGLISSFLFFSTNCVYYWGAFFRVDMLAVMFSLLGFYIASKHEHDITSKYLWLSLVPFVLAVYTKQSQVFALLAVSVWLFFKDWKLSVKYFSSFILICGVIFLFVNYVTKGQFWVHLIEYQNVPWKLGLIIGSNYYFLLYFSVLVVIGLAYVINSLTREDLSLFSLYFLTTGFITAILVGHVGSAVYYYIEFVAIACILVGFSSVELFELRDESFKWRNREASDPKKVLLCTFLIVQLLIFANIPYISMGETLRYPFYGYTPRHDDLVKGQIVSSYISNSPGLVLIEEQGFAVLNNKEVYFDFMQLNLLQRTGAFDSSPIQKDIENQKFSLIVLSNECLSQNILDAIHANYETVDVVDVKVRYDYYIYVPKVG